MYKYLLTVTFYLLVNVALAIDLTKVNLNHHYNPYANISLTLQVVEDEGNFIIYYKLKFGPDKKSEDFQASFLAQPQYITEDHRNITSAVDRKTMLSNEAESYFQVKIPKAFADTLIVIEYLDLIERKSYYFDIPLLLEEDFPQAQIQPKGMDDLPILENYIRAATPIYMPTGKSTIHAYYYTYSFPPATPPMTFERLTAKSTFKIDTVYRYAPNDTILLIKEGLYLFQTDTTSLAAKPLMVLGHNYPKYTTLEQLITATRYITSTNEYRNVLAKKNKDAFDELWLTMSGSASRAKTNIRLYYQRIEEANRFFTSYKEGWKTDQGMIYTIFGSPDILVKGQDYQQWKYYGNEERAELSFTFVKVKDIFSRSHFELVKNSKYGNAWLKAIEKWRTGK